jgi:DNA sulfur modification protein DndC
MYRNAQAGECPLVVDTTTPSCGNSRFGCWTCTVVQQDKSMAAMIDAGEDWLEPMLAFRNWLAETQDPARKAEIRDVKRRDGRVHERKIDGKTVGYIPGPYLLSFRREILRRLLQAQKDVRLRSVKHDEVLIMRAELDRIRQIWRLEEGDWEDSLPQIYFDATGEEVEWADDDWSGMGADEQELLQRVAGKHKLDPDRLTELFDLEREMHGMSRRSQIYTKIDSVFSKDWRPRDQVIRLHVLDASAAMNEEATTEPQ